MRSLYNPNALLQRRSVAARAAASPATGAAQVQKVKLGKSGLEVTRIVNGCWQLAGGHGREVFDNLMEKLDAHADSGFTSFDTADIYGSSERILGDFARARREAGKQPGVQLLTKYVPDIFRARQTPATVEAAIDKSRAALQVAALDLVQLHWWDYNIPGMTDVALLLADLQAKGKIKEVATTNMDCNALEAILDAGVQVAANQVQFSLFDRRPLNGMVKLCQERGVKILSYGSLGGGLLSDKHVVAAPSKGLFGQARYPNVDLNTSSLKMYYKGAVTAFGGQDLWRELLTVLRRVADRHTVPGGQQASTVANVALAWVMAQGGGDLVLPIVGVRGAEHISDNAAALALTLTPEDMAEIQQVLKQAKGPSGDIYSFERGD